MSPDGYTGREPSIAARDVAVAHDQDYFQVTKETLPPGATAIIDDREPIVIGYQVVRGGITWTYGLDGHVVSIDEPGLETPLIDPIDLIFIVGGLGRLLLRGLVRGGEEVAGKIAAQAAADVAGKAVSARVASLLRVAFRVLVQRELKFTATTAARMADPARFVPLNILKLAVRYGVRDADPDGVPGAFRYSIQMFRAAKMLGKPAREYTLRVIVREADWTVLHFHYE